MTLEARAGDLLFVRRRRTWTSFWASPRGALISWRIQSVARSTWNHVAVFETPELLIEAKWSGVIRTPVVAYSRRPEIYKLEVRRRPTPKYAHVGAFNWLRGQLGDDYDMALIAKMRWAALRNGSDGIGQVLLDYDADDAWICTELAEFFWRRSGVEGAKVSMSWAGVATVA